jgi:sugar/nucleoside kinase (ribokinase family)
VVDSNGAGDAYAAGFLLGWLSGEPPLRCAQYGAIAGAFACTVPATATDSVSRAELLARAGDL